MLEKPAGQRLDAFRDLVDLAQQKHLHVQMIYLFRYMSAVQELLKQVRSGGWATSTSSAHRLPKDPGSYDRYVAELGATRGASFSRWPAT